jgi:hypothetical protein
MDKHLHAGNFRAHLVDMPGFKSSVDRTVAAPEDQFRFTQLFFGISTEILVRIPESHLVERNSEFRTGVATKMLIREEKHFVELF